MWHSHLLAATLALIAGVAAVGGGRFIAVPGARELGRFLNSRFASAANDAMPQAPGADLVLSRCVICHSLEVATQQRQGPRGWAEIIDRMISYGAPIQTEEHAAMINYLVLHFGDPAGR